MGGVQRNVGGGATDRRRGGTRAASLPAPDARAGKEHPDALGARCDDGDEQPANEHCGNGRPRCSHRERARGRARRGTARQGPLPRQAAYTDPPAGTAAAAAPCHSVAAGQADTSPPATRSSTAVEADLSGPAPSPGPTAASAHPTPASGPSASPDTALGADRSGARTESGS